MIARSLIFFLLMILLPDLYLYRRYVGRRRPLWVKIVWWLATVVMLTYTMMLYMERDFTPTPQTSLNFYLILLGVFTIPKVLLTLTTWIGDRLCRRNSPRRKWGTGVGIMLGMMCVYATIYGFTLGFSKFEVNCVDYYSKQLPASFDGYRIAVFSDIHVASYSGDDQQTLKAAIDSINAMNADLIVFLGDIQNKLPDELTEHAGILSSLKARDGVLSVMGNHDYALYTELDSLQEMKNILKTEDMQRSFGWKLLLNENVTIHRGADSIFVAGMEGNDETRQTFGVASAEKSMEGIPQGSFTVMLVHNPQEWRKRVLPLTEAQLTLSGHTHGGQVGIPGFRPTMLTYSEDSGMYEEGGRHLLVSKGLGGLIPMRFGVTGEVVLMTLHRENQ